MKLWFTQYMLPDGRRKPIETEVSDDLRDKVQAILDAGLKFEIEILRNGMVSATICDHDNDMGDLAYSITSNGPAVTEGIEKMIREFDVADYKERVDVI